MTTLLGLLLILTPCVAISAVGKAAGSRTITQVVELLQGMMEKSKADGNTERELFAKFKCYCDINTAEKTSEIESLTEEITVLESKIEALQASTGTLSEEVAKLDADMASNKASQGAAQTLRGNRNKDFEALNLDLEKAIGQMRDAIKTLAEVGADQTTAGAAADHKFMMAGFDRENPVLLKIKTSVKQALIAASAMLNGKLQQKHAEVIESFLQAPFTGTYTAQSGEVVGILKDMRDTFRANKQAAIATEGKEVKAHTKFMNNMRKAFGEMEDSHTLKQSKLGTNDGDLSTKKTQLTQAVERKADAEEFLAQLTDMCTKKADEYKQRVMLRTNEDAAIAEAISILNSDAAFATFGGVSATSTGSTGAGFLQTRSVRRHRQAAATESEAQRKAVTAFLAPRAASSPRIAMVQALLQAKNPFRVVLKEITKMIEIIQREEAADVEQDQWCEGERSKHNGIVTTKTNEISGLDSDISVLKATIDDPVTGLKKMIADDEIALEENTNSQATETKERTEENLAYQKDVANLVEAQNLLKKAVKVLTSYYTTITLVQTGNAEPRQDMLSWEGGANQAEGAYAGQSDAGTGAINMLEFILGESSKEETMAHDNERSAQHSFEDSMAELTTEEGRLRTELARLQGELSQAELDLMAKEKLHKATVAEKEASEAYLAKIKRGCDWIDANLANRQQSRGDETKALLDAEKLIKATPAYTAAVEEKHQEGLGECKEKCQGADEAGAMCKACLADTSVPGYCAGHPDTPGC